MRVAIEALFLLLGLAAGLALTWACAWAYPLGRTDIWACGLTAMAVTLLMSVGPFRRARAADRVRR